MTASEKRARKPDACPHGVVECRLVCEACAKDRGEHCIGDVFTEYDGPSNCPGDYALVDRLRGIYKNAGGTHRFGTAPIAREAADRILALEAALAEANEKLFVIQRIAHELGGNAK